jgi:hypothetical protein
LGFHHLVGHTVSFWAALIHLANFIYPALGLAVLVSLAAHWLAPKPRRGLKLGHAMALNAALGVAVLAGGLIYFGNDGKMATYATLVCVSATTAFVAQGLWRRG